MLQAEAARERLIQILWETEAFKAEDEPIFELASGGRSRFYIDGKTALSYAETREIVGSLCLERLNLDELDAVGGLVFGACPIAQAISEAAYRQAGKSLRFFFVRKEPKKYGLQKWVEGAVDKGDRVLIVDDVITSGKSTLAAISRSREAGLKVVKVLAMVDRQEQGGRQAIEAEAPFEALCTLSDLLASRDASR